MRIDDKLSPPANTALTSPRGGSDALAAGSVPALSTGAFGEALAQVRQAPGSRVVARGDTLIGVVREQAAQRGQVISPAQAFRQAQQLARDSGIANPNRIFPGQQLALTGLHAQLDTGLGAGPASATSSAMAVPAANVLRTAFTGKPAAPLSSGAPAGRSPGASAGTSAGSSSGAASNLAGKSAPVDVAAAASDAADAAAVAAGGHPVLERTLDRAVAKGFIPAIERGDVRDKILKLASTHRFKPDDFARMTLMESDGMNPRATNQRCHGIIQFCDGNDRGAASVGFAANPRVILGLSVYQQLHLVDKYFSEVGVKAQTNGQAPASLDDLYLSVLMPAARGNSQPNAPLNIPGGQANYLHVGRDRSAPITRQSILDGLQQNANERLAPFPSPRGRLQALRGAGYEEILPNQPPLPRLR